MQGKTVKGQPVAQISNRADLIQALTVASQLEHGLMLMYLYAAFSMKAFPEELKAYPQPEVLRNKLRDWEASILRVARQEMEHLGFVCNLLTAIGGNQYFDRPNFPQPKEFWPVDLPIELERFNRRTLLRFLAFEKPEKLVDPVIDPLYEQETKALKVGATQPIEVRFTSIGDLYGQIRKAFETFPEEELFIGPTQVQVNNDTLFGAGSMSKPTYDMFVFKVYDRQSAINAIDEIIEQGEGTLSNKKQLSVEDLDPLCHYMLFRRVLIEYMGGEDKLRNPRPAFEGARNCVTNPAWELHQDTITRQVFAGGSPVQSSMSVALITHPWTRDMMGITNTAYEILMQMLVRLYTGADTPNEVNGLVQTVFFPMMTMVIRPLSELMSLLPAFKGGTGGYTAGAGFEFFRTIGFLPHKPAAWITIEESLSENAANYEKAIKTMPSDLKQILTAAGYKPDVALPFIGANLQRISMNFKSYMNI